MRTGTPRRAERMIPVVTSFNEAGPMRTGTLAAAGIQHGILMGLQ